MTSKPEGKAEAAASRKKKARWLLRMQLRMDPRQQRNLLLLLLALILTVIIIPKGGFAPVYYQPGDIASRDVKAPRDLLIPDVALTEKKKAEAEASIRPLYDYEAGAGRDALTRVMGQFRQFAEGTAGEIPAEVSSGGLADLGSPEELAAIGTLIGTEGISASLRNALSAPLGKKFVPNLSLFLSDLERGVVIRNLASRQESAVDPTEEVIGLEQTQQEVNAAIQKVSGFSSAQRKILSAALQRELRPNLTLNRNETEARKKSAREAVTPVLFQVKKGEMIVREGERVTSEQISKLRALRDIGNDYASLRTALGLLLGIMVLLYSTHRFARGNIRKYKPVNRDLLFLVVTFVGLFVLIKIAIFVSTALESAFPYIDSASYYYLFPFAVGAMLIRIVLNSEVAFVFAILSSLVMGMLFGNNLFIALYTLVGSLTGAHWVRHCKERTTLYRAGMRLSVVNVGMILALHLMGGRLLDLQLLYKLSFGLAGGFICALIVTGTVPLVESLFRYTTDIKLLELANMNTPVLRELMIQAPGTYHHSIIVGNLVEAAAEAINANPLLARVAAYYHDIGKIRKPLYFVENMKGTENKHDKLAPSMSALILMSHVKDGVEVAREYKLGETLVEIIRQHHGTGLIKFFFEKAKSKEAPEVQQVNERDYRYPGPKPQTREAALIMLADAVEAASRTLTDPTPARIQGMVQKIINNIFIDGQLDECELTLKDLHAIARSFNRILSGIFHHRIDYPEPAYKEREKEGSKRKTGEDTNRESPKEAKDKDSDTKKGSTEDLKRLGMS